MNRFGTILLAIMFCIFPEAHSQDRVVEPDLLFECTVKPAQGHYYYPLFGHYPSGSNITVDAFRAYLEESLSYKNILCSTGSFIPAPEFEQNKKIIHHELFTGHGFPDDFLRNRNIWLTNTTDPFGNAVSLIMIDAPIAASVDLGFLSPRRILFSFFRILLYPFLLCIRPFLSLLRGELTYTFKNSIQVHTMGTGIQWSFQHGFIVNNRVPHQNEDLTVNPQ